MIDLSRKMRIVERAYAQDSRPWIIGFSGGKDSSALLKLVYSAVLKSPQQKRPLVVVYCDTGVENPIVANYVTAVLSNLLEEARRDKLPIRVLKAEPLLEHRFFVKLIGRGYPPPNNFFRWCTKDLRMRPVWRVIDSVAENNAVIVLGVRRGESAQRDRTLDKQTINSSGVTRQSERREYPVYYPILDFTVEDVWEALFALEKPESIKAAALADLYRNAGGECPLIREVKGAPCGKGRFGCWTCTVVRNDRSAQNLIISGHKTLEPLLEFRNWLVAIRNERRYRARWRRSGVRSSGPFTLDARRMILARLKRIQLASGYSLISKHEVACIRKLWRADERDPEYRE
jgi:DNA sulfur modification protein DndC